MSNLSWTARSPARPWTLGNLRDDPNSLAWLRDQISRAPGWAEGYAQLVHLASQPSQPPIDLKTHATSGPPSEADRLLGDLLKATVNDARDELIRAGDSIEDRSQSLGESDWVQAPPWPPESVAQLIRRRLRSGDDPGPWLDTLAAQIVPEPAARAWLRASWNRPRRPIDGATLSEIAEAAGGRLAREPRFRAWLRGEWRAWARQKYRLIAREANESRS